MTSLLFSKAFWLAAVGRAVATFAQALGSLIGLTGIGVVHIDWTSDLYVAGVAALLSVLKSIASVYPIASLPPASEPISESAPAASTVTVSTPVASTPAIVTSPGTVVQSESAAPTITFHTSADAAAIAQELAARVAVAAPSPEAIPPAPAVPVAGIVS